jgi:hypothetical protein
MIGADESGCIDVSCPKHGFIARIIAGADILCRKCGKWIKAESSAQAQKRQKARERKQRSRTKGRICEIDSLGHRNVTLSARVE